MQSILRSGRYLFAAAVTGFGITQFVTGNFLSTLIPVPAGLPARTFLLYFISTVLVAGGACMLADRTAPRASLLLGFFFLLLFIWPHAALLIPDLHNGGEWAVAAEMLSYAGGAFLIAGLLSGRSAVNDRPVPAAQKMYIVGRWLLILALLIFGIQHFIYSDYIVTLIPAWIPFPVFWTWVVRLAFLLAALSLAINIKTRLACTLLGLLFFLWVILLHAPRVVASPRMEAEWTSFFVALGLCGLFFALAAGPVRKGGL